MMTAGCLRAFPQAQPIRVLSSPYLGSAPLYLAQEQGYFRQEGLDVQIQEGEGSRTTIPLLAGGKADVAFGTLAPQVFNAINRGARIRMVAARSKFTGACPEQRRVYGSRQAFPGGFNDLRQMKGKRVAFDVRLSIATYAMSKALAMTGLTKDDFTIVQLEDREAAAMLAAGKIDVCFGASSTIQNSAVLDRVVAGPSFSVLLPDFAHGHILYGRRLLDGPPAEGAKFLRALLRASRDYVAGKDPEWLKQFARENGYDEQKLKNRCRAEVDADGTIDEKDMAAYIDWALREKLVTAPVKVSDCVDYRFLKEAKRA